MTPGKAWGLFGERLKGADHIVSRLKAATTPRVSFGRSLVGRNERSELRRMFSVDRWVTRFALTHPTHNIFHFAFEFDVGTHSRRRASQPKADQAARSAVRAGNANLPAAQGCAVWQAPTSARSGRSRASMRSAAFVHPCTAQGSAAPGRAFDVQGRTNVWPAQGCALGQTFGLPFFARTKKGNPLPRD
jgi:hypothetical protein